MNRKSSIERNFEIQLSLLRQTRSDFRGSPGGIPLYSADFAILFPYIVPRAMQPSPETDTLAQISNNIFLSINDRARHAPFHVILPFSTLLEIFERFSWQRKYYIDVAESADFAHSVKDYLITGSQAASILTQQVQAHIPANDSYKCLANFTELLRKGFIKSYGDFFSYSDFSDFVKSSSALESMKNELNSVRSYKQADPQKRAFHKDMDAMHLLMCRSAQQADSEHGVYYTGPPSLRRLFGANSANYTRAPEVPLLNLYALGFVDKA